jgi:hypothetical protein
MANETPIHDATWPAQVRVFMPPRYYLYLAIGALVLFVGATTGSVWLALPNPDGSFAHPVTAAVVFTCGYGSIALLALYLLVACFRTSVVTTEGVVRINGAFRCRTVVLAEVTRAVWRGWPAGGSLVLYGPTCRVALSFASYRGGQQLAGVFRDSLPAEVQHGFGRFEAMNAPHSAAFRRRLEKDRRIATALAPVLGAALIGYAIWWDP